MTQTIKSSENKFLNIYKTIFIFAIILLLNILCLKDTAMGPWFCLGMPLFVLVSSLYYFKVPHFHFVLQFIISLPIPAICFYLLENIIRYDGQEFVFDMLETTISPELMRINFALYYIFFMAIFVIIGKLGLTIRVYTAVCYITAIANYFVIMFRSSPIIPSDIYSINTAAKVAAGYTFYISQPILLMSYGFILIFIISDKFDFALPKYQSGWKVILVRLSVSCILIGGAGSICNYVQRQSHAYCEIDDMDLALFSTMNMTRENGYLVTTVYSMQFLDVEKPSGYSKAKAEEILANYSSDSIFDSSGLWSVNLGDSRANIILVMNEAYSDLSVLGDFSTNVDYMPFTHRLEQGNENTISGYLYSSVLGGNTANTEFEFLTGCSMALLPSGSIPYQQYVNNETDSIASILSDQGYYSAATHPYKSDGWKRPKVYPLLGFNDCYFEDNMPNLEYIRAYASDETLYDFVNKMICTTDNAPYFSFSVTMQNHGGYGNNFANNFIPNVTLTDCNSGFLNNYLSLIRRSDEAFEKLINYYSSVSEPTLIVMFGDHQPNDLVVKDIYTLNGIDTDNLSEAEKYNRYKVPLIIWANYDIPEATDFETSANYLSGIVTKLSGNETDKYQNFLETLRQEIPAISATGFLDKNGKHHTIDDLDSSSKLINDYKILQYYKIFE